MMAAAITEDGGDQSLTARGYSTATGKRVAITPTALNACNQVPGNLFCVGTTQAKRVSLYLPRSKLMRKQKYRVMVVDDDESVRHSLYKLLGSEGYEVTLAADGAEAVVSFRQKQFDMDLLLVDLNLPVKNGWVTVNQALELNPHLPVFIITALSHQRELAEAAGVSALVEKPIDVAELLQLIRKQLTNSASSAPVYPHQRKLPFYHVPAMHYRLPSVETSEHIIPYNRWGLNE